MPVTRKSVKKTSPKRRGRPTKTSPKRRGRPTKTSLKRRGRPTRRRMNAPEEFKQETIDALTLLKTRVEDSEEWFEDCGSLRFIIEGIEEIIQKLE